MSDFAIVTSCAPTLAGLKTGSLFTEPCTDKASLEQEIAEMNRILNTGSLAWSTVCAGSVSVFSVLPSSPTKSACFWGIRPKT